MTDAKCGKEYIMKMVQFDTKTYGYERRQELVRCKDCKHYEMPKYGELGMCTLIGMVSKTTFFCADGKREKT